MDNVVEISQCPVNQGPEDLIALLGVLATFLLLGWLIRRYRNRR